MALPLTSCQDTSDCFEEFPGISVFCYENPEWSNNTFFCECSNFFGWIGENCEKVSSMLIYSRISFLLQLIWPFLLVFPTLRTLWYHVQYVKVTGERLSAIFYTGVLVLIGAVAWIIYAGLYVRALFDPNQYEVAIEKFPGEDDSVSTGIKFQVLARAALALNACLQAIIAIQITTTWVQVIEKLKHIFPEILSTKVTRVTISLLILLAMFIVVPLAIANHVELMSYAIALLSVAIILIFGWAFWKMNKVLKQFGSEQTTDGTLRLIRWSARINIAMLLLVGISGIMYSISYSYTEFDLEPGDFNVSAFSADFGVFAGLVLLSFDSWYCHVLSRKLLKLDASQSNWVPSFTKSPKSSNDKSGNTTGKLVSKIEEIKSESADLDFSGKI